MPIENTSLSVDDAEARARNGMDILVSPMGMHTNLALSRMEKIANIFQGMDLPLIQKIADTFQGLDLTLIRRFLEGLDASNVDSDLLYKNLVGASPEVCEADVISVVARCLDQYMKIIFQEERAIFGDLVGHDLPFSTSDGDGITYARLRSFMDAHRTSPLYPLCSELLSRSELALLTEFKVATGGTSTFSCMEFSQEMGTFHGSFLRRDRVTTAHLLSEVLHVGVRTPLEDQDLSGRFHTLKFGTWNFNHPKTLFTSGLRMLVVEDLFRRLQSGVLRFQGYLVPYIGISLMKMFLVQKIPHSLRVTYGSIKAELKKDGHDITPNHIYDMEIIKNTLPAPSLPYTR